MEQFDPNYSGWIEGNITTVLVVDPGYAPNHVLDHAQPFDVRVAWNISGIFAPLWLQALGGNWNVEVYAESIGGGPEKLLVSDSSVAADPSRLDYEVTVTVPAFTLEAGNPASDVSGVYKLVVTVALDSTFDLFDGIGFSEGPLIQVR